jgi:hypothetical protein
VHQLPSDRPVSAHIQGVLQVRLFFQVRRIFEVSTNFQFPASLAFPAKAEDETGLVGVQSMSSLLISSLITGEEPFNDGCPKTLVCVDR